VIKSWNSEKKAFFIMFQNSKKFILDQVLELKKIPFLIEKFWNVKKPILELKRCWKLGRNQ
jgi:hypothetical protein